MNDLNLWLSFKAGDNDAYEMIYRKYIDMLYEYGIAVYSDKAVVQDCIHDLFVRLYQNREMLADTDNIGLYLAKALKNRILTNIEKQSKLVSLVSTSLERSTSLNSVGDILLDECDENERIEIIESCIDSMPKRQQEVIRLRYFKGLELTEISETMQMNYQSVQNLLQRALKYLRNSTLSSYKEVALLIILKIM